MNRASLVVVSSILAVLVLRSATAAQTEVTSSDRSTWHIDSALLRVTLDTETGGLSVLDRRIGYEWRQAPPGSPATPELSIRRAPHPPHIDGERGDWAAEPTFVLTPEMLADAREVDGAHDLSARVWCLWDEQFLYLAVAVRDQRLQWPGPDQEQWWEADTVELWVGDKQVALLPAGDTVGTWSRDGAVAGAAVAMRPTADGYQIETALPWEALAADVRPQPGSRLPFALGVNDADDPAGRQGQLYFPRTWVHSARDTFARVTLADETGRAPEQAVEPQPACRDVRAIDEPPAGLRYETDLREAGGRELPATVSLRVPDDEADLIVGIEMPEEKELGVIQGLGPLLLPREDAEILAPHYGNGIAVPATLLDWRGRSWSTWGSLDMPWVGLTDGEKGYLLLFETPDDGVVRLEALRSEEADFLAPRADFQGSKGRFAYPRLVRYRFMSEGGHTAICKRYRDYARQQGLVVTLREKARRVPAVDRLIGAPDFWGVPGVEWCREARAAGIERALVNGRWSPEDMQQMVEMGYLVSEYDNYVDLLEGERGPNGTYGPLEEDARMDASGEMVKGWLTWDKQTQFYKRCSATAREAAEREIPPLLETYPYNTRFLDVTTASGLRECYHPDHPLTRTGDRRENLELAEYVKGLGLVLGGEHGRWWGAPVYDYWEGMQSGGFYSWPAGHVGQDIPPTREEIGEEYLTWGIGHQRRVPLWELVFGDCVVSTWYWGDSTGHLYEAAPEIADRKDLFNMLYGTVPLFWLNRHFGLNWERHRERLLESYRNTCKLHEQIGYDEMLSHEFVTEDRAVQRTRFSSGTEVTVNFGEDPYEVEGESGTYVLGRYGFLAEGPRVLQYRALSGQEITFIRTPGYLFCDAAGAEHDFGPVQTRGRVTIRRPSAEEERLLVSHSGGEAAIRLREVAADAPHEAARLRMFALDATSERIGYRRVVLTDGRLRLREDDGQAELAWGREIQAPDLEVAERRVELTPAEVRQGEPLTVRARITNRGGEPARNARVTLTVGGRVTVERAVTIQPLRFAEIEFEVDTTPLDGRRRLTVRADCSQRELMTSNNAATVEAFVTPDLARWSRRRSITVTNDDVRRNEAVVQSHVDFGEAVAADSVRVLEESGGEYQLVPGQLDPVGEGGEGQLLWVMPGETAPGQVRRFIVVYDPAQVPERHRPAPGAVWDEEAAAITTKAYRAVFNEGAIGAVYNRLGDLPEASIFSGIVVSSAETGWVHEEGEVERMRVVSAGPVRTVVEVEKALKGDHRCTKRYEFYPRYFIVRGSCEPRIGCLSRAYYALPCVYEDDAGNTARIDGEGDAEDVAGKNPKPEWYAAYCPQWAHSCVNLGEASNVTYWDGGAWGGVALNAGNSGVTEVAYVFHEGQPDAS
ncbi:MAG: glycoside hydrolase, partial [Armatimonadota bacterium]